jgi:hypothetical protein
MRAKEFINEETTKPLRKSAKASISGLRKNPALDNNNNPYLAYRMGIAMAGSPDETMYQKGPLGSSFITTDYTDADSEIRKGAEKIMGVRSQEVTGKGSAETDLVNKQSIVAKPKRNKYGV